MSSLKVAFITSSWLDRDGYGCLLSSFVNYHEGRGDDVVVYHEDNSHASDSCGPVKVANLSLLLDSAMNGDDEFLFHCDLVFVSFLPYYPLMEICRFITACPVVFIYPGITPFHLYPDYDPLKEFTRRGLAHLALMKYGDRVIVNSQFMATELTGFINIEKSAVNIVPIPVISSDELEHRLNEISASAGKTDKHCASVGSFTEVESSSLTGKNKDAVVRSPLLLYVGRISGNKRVDILLTAVAVLKQAFPDIHLIIAGMHNRLFSSQYMVDLTEMICELSIGDNVEFLSDIAADELEQLYRKADYFVTASLHEGFCIPVAEAMANGLTPVVPDIAASPETAGEGGIVYKACDGNDLAEVIKRAWSDFSTDGERKNYERKVAALNEARRFTFEKFSSALEAVTAPLLKPDSTVPSSSQIPDSKVPSSSHTPDSKVTCSSHSKDVLCSEGSNERIPMCCLSAGADSLSSYGRSFRRINLCDKESYHYFPYRDSFSFPLFGSLIRWLRRKLTFPVEKSVMRPVIEQQSLWNRLMVEELRELQAEVRRLKNGQGFGNESASQGTSSDEQNSSSDHSSDKT